MRRWIVRSVLGLGVVAALLLPPSPQRFTQRVSSSSTIGIMKFALRGEYEALAAAVWLDTIVARTALDGGKIVAGAITQADSVTTEDAYALLRADMEALGIQEPRVRVGAFWFESELLGERSRGMVGLQAKVLSREGEDPFCFVTRTRSRMGLQAPLDRASPLDVPVLQLCAFYARYGAPGPQVSQWLRDGALLLAMDPGGRVRPSAGELLSSPFPRRVWRGRWEAEQVSCAGGRMEVCATLFAAPANGPYRLQPVSRFSTAVVTSSGFGPNFGAVLGDLAREFGDERFEAFWSSSQPVPEAFRAAFGVSHAEWTRTWLLDEYGPVTLGARMNAGTVVLTLLGIAFWAGIGVATARRRRVA